MPLFLISFYKVNKKILFSMHLHFIAIGGAIMHQLAISSLRNGQKVTGSDDFIADPARTNLKLAGILPEKEGWFPEKIDENISAIILGMHAKKDNPELLKAQELQIPIYSFPEYIYKHAVNKKRIVIAGSHGKTTTTSMIMHALKKADFDFDYLVGSKVPGFEYSVKLSDAPIIVLEGDEYLSSAIERKPKIHFYHPHIATITGIAWDHINVFPTFENYKEQFSKFIDMIQENGSLIYNAKDKEVVSIIEKKQNSIKKLPYIASKYRINQDLDCIEVEDNNNFYPLEIFGEHNLQNLEAARRVCNILGIANDSFYKYMRDFRGASRRLEVISEDNSLRIFKDFAHAPSKVEASLKAMRERYPNHYLIAILELHTYSSLNKNFIDNYKNSLKPADKAAVFYSADALRIKNMDKIPSDLIEKAFNQKDLSIFEQSNALSHWIQDIIENTDKDLCLLFMSSGNFDQMNLHFNKTIL